MVSSYDFVRPADAERPRPSQGSQHSPAGRGVGAAPFPGANARFSARRAACTGGASLRGCHGAPPEPLRSAARAQAVPGVAARALVPVPRPPGVVVASACAVPLICARSLAACCRRARLRPARRRRPARCRVRRRRRGLLRRRPTRPGRRRPPTSATRSCRPVRALPRLASQAATAWGCHSAADARAYEV
jgi:hypothetical protein